MVGGSISAQSHDLNRREIAGVSIRDLVAQYGTPTYVYDAATMVKRLQELAAFDVVRFAQKANSSLAIVDLLRRHGALVDAVSAGEVMRAIAAGYSTHGDPEPIVFTADVFDRDALEIVKKYQLHCNIGSPDMLPQYAELVPHGSVTLRINPGFGHGHSQKTNTGGPQSKHGIWHEQLPEVLRQASELGLTVSGLHMHIGSGTDLEHLAQVCGAMHGVALEVGDSVTAISAGGGLPIPYRTADPSIDLGEYFRLWDEVRQDLAGRFGHPVRLEIEPGRYLTAEAGYLIAEIRAIKTMGENKFYLLDAGFNALARPILYGAYHPMSIATRDGRQVEQLQEVVVGGPLCESGDIFTQEEGGFVSSRQLPAAEVGDWLVIEAAGAYGAVMASNYNSKAFPAEVMIENGYSSCIRKRQPLDDLYRYEQIPPRD